MFNWFKKRRKVGKNPNLSEKYGEKPPMPSPPPPKKYYVNPTPKIEPIQEDTFARDMLVTMVILDSFIGD